MSAFGHVRGTLPPRHEPRLVWRFLVVTVVGLAIAGTGILVIVERTLAGETERQAVDRARVTTSALLDRRLRLADFTGRLTPARREQLTALFTPAELGAGSRGATLYGPRGAVFSTAGPDLRTPQSSLVVNARTGTVASAVVSTGSGRILRTMLPLRLGSREVGVVELDQDYGAIAAAARRTSLLAAGILEALLVVLCALLLPPLGKVSRRLHRQVEQLDWLASHDELTGLLNRPGFNRTFSETLSAPGARGTLVLVGLDRFHEITETIGSEQGDLLLVGVATRLQSAFTAHAVARLGGDEFAILLPAARVTALTHAGEAIQDQFDSALSVNGIRVGLGVRVGAVQYPEHGRDPDTLLRHASIALTSAKHESNRLKMYSEQLERTDVAQLALISDLRTGLRDGQLVVHYQTQADVGTRAIRGVEALVRWQHPKHGLLTASEFIRTVERTDLISELGRHVLAAAVQQWSTWHRDGVVLDLAVNLSTVDLLDLTLPGTIVDLLIEHSMPADHLILEITESTLLHHERRSHRVLRQLERIGVCLAIDDFGTGYSSLATLRKLPIRQVKIDRSFVDGIPEDTDNDTIVRSTIQLAHTLGATVVAEGVETARQLKRLAALGCDTAQGYLIGRPALPDQLDFAPLGDLERQVAAQALTSAKL